MHEATIAQSILEIASSRLIQTPHAANVSKVEVLAGEFRNVDVESLLFAFDTLKDQFDGLSECVLDVQTVQAEALCESGGHHYHPSFYSVFRCDRCGSGIGQLIRGEELDVVNVTLQANPQ